MIANLVSKIIDNIQLKISNVYIRIEDTLSIPRMPIVLGLVIGSIQAETMNDRWQPQFTANAEITNKEFSIKDFAVYMNFQEMPGPGMSDQAEILFEQIT
jgi:Vacuolar sorting-associated protein 13, N-terminal